jgi:hypothetical protein
MSGNRFGAVRDDRVRIVATPGPIAPRLSLHFSSGIGRDIEAIAEDETVQVGKRYTAATQEISMAKKLARALLTPLLAASVMLPQTALARHHYVHRGYSHSCSSGKGVIGTVVGGAGGALIGGAAIGGPVAIIAGGVGGALLGRHIDKQNVRHRHGCA